MKRKASNVGLSKEELDELYAELEKKPPNMELIAPKSIGRPIEKIAKSIGGSEINIYGGMLPCIGNLMENASVQLKEGHIQNIVLWNFGLGIRGSNKSGALDVSMIPLIILENLEHDIAEKKFVLEIKQANEVAGENPTRRRRLEYDRKQSQRALINGTFAGLEDVLLSKKNGNVSPNIVLILDEASLLLSNLEKDEAFESIFLSLYSGKPIRSNTRKGGFLEVDNPRVQVMGYSQPETILKFMNKGDDTGGKLER